MAEKLLSDIAEPVDLTAEAKRQEAAVLGGSPALMDIAEPVGPKQLPAGEKFGAFGQGATAGFARAAPVVSGAFAGGRIGALGGPAGALGGVLLGAGAGYLAGDPIQYGLSKVEIPGMDAPLTFESLESVPLELRPYAVAGEAVGGSVPFGAAPYELARQGIKFAPSLTGRLLNGITAGAERTPGVFATIELQSAISAGALEGVAEEMAPGDLLKRMSAGVVGGVLNPARHIMSLSNGAVTRAKSLVSAWSPTARRGAAAKTLQDIFAEFGEEPALAAAKIRSELGELPEGLVLTPGQLTGSPALLSLEATLVNNSAKFGNTSKMMAKSSMEAIGTLLGVMAKEGDPQSLRMASQIRAEYFKGLMASRLSNAEEAARLAAANIDLTGATSAADFGKRVDDVMSRAMKDVRATEKDLWGKVDKDIPGEANSIIGRFDSLKAERLPEEKLPDVVEKFVRRVRGEPAADLPEDIGGLLEKTFGVQINAPKPVSNVPTTSGELLRFRSRMLEFSRESAGKNDWSDARIYGELAEAALDDLAEMPDANVALDAARTWSRELHDTFSRTFAGQVLDRKGSGAARIPPELVMKRALGGGKEGAELNFRQLEEAAQKAGSQYVSELLDLQERTLRQAASQSVDPTTGRVNPLRLARFRKDNAELLARFPEVAENLKNAGVAEDLLRTTGATGKVAAQKIANKAAFAQVLKVEDPVRAVERSLRGGSPVKDFQAIAKVAKRGGPEAMAGLKSSVMTMAHDAASKGGFSFAKYQDAFDTPLITGGPKLRDLMIHHKIMTSTDMKTMDKLLDRAARIEKATITGEALEGVLSKSDALIDMVIRIGGANLAKLSPTGGAHPLIVGGAGSRFARQVFDKVPKTRIRDILIEVSENPAMMASLLEETPTPAAKLAKARQMNAFLWQMGVSEE